MNEAEKNRFLPFAAACVKLSYKTPIKGRFLEASADIPAGTVLVSEPAFAAVVSAECERTCCHHCFACNPAENWILCDRCGVRYCSPDCQSRANKLYHWLECQHGDLINQAAKLDRGILLVVRILLAAHHNSSLTSTKLDPCSIQFFSIVAVSESRPEGKQIPGCDHSGCFRGDYCSVYSLTTHEERQPQLTPYHQKVIHQLAIALSSDITQTAIDGHDPDTGILECQSSVNKLCLSDSHKTDIIEKLLLHHLMQIPCNVHAITSITSKEGSTECSSVESQEQVRLGMAIFPTASLLNHSCDPNTIVSYEGRQITIRATKKICKGEEILHCYGPHVKHMPTAERQAVLQNQYFFDCDCTACIRDSLTSNPFPDIFRCPQCSELLKAVRKDKGFCTQCKTSYDMASSLQEWKEALSLYNSGIQSMENDCHEEALRLFRKALKLHKRLLHVSSKTLGQTHDSIAEAYAFLEKFAKAALHCEASCKTVEAFYGPDSIELANELFKLSQLQFNARKAEQVLDTTHRAIRLLSLYYGDKDERVVELQQMRACACSSRGIGVTPTETA